MSGSYEELHGPGSSAGSLVLLGAQAGGLGAGRRTSIGGPPGDQPEDEEQQALLQEQDGEKLDLDKLFTRLNWRLLPLFWLMVVVNYLDRTNLAFAAIQLTRDMAFTPKVYGFGSGLFFLSYATLQVPSNLILRRVGGPLWLGIIVSTWGFCACLFAGMRTHTQFYVLRFLLGVAEAGAFPGMWYFINRFYPPERITLAYAVVESGISLSHTVAAPLAAALLTLDGVHGLSGWKWLFLLEGLPSVVLGLVLWRSLPASPAQAKFLAPHERTYLTARMAAVHAQAAHGSHSSHGSQTVKQVEPGSVPHVDRSPVASGSAGSNGLPGSGSATGSSSSSGSAAGWSEEWSALRAALHNPAVWYMGCMKFLHDIAGYGVIFFTPWIVQALLKGEALDIDGSKAAGGEGGHGAHGAHGSGDKGVAAALLTSVPFAVAAGVAFAIAHRAQRVGEHHLHVGAPYLLCGAVFSAFPLLATSSPVGAFACLVVGVSGVFAGAAPSLSLLSEVAAGPGLVAALPLYNSLGNVGGFLGPWLTGVLIARTNSFAAPTTLMGFSLAAAGAMAMLLPRAIGAKAGLGQGHGAGSGIGSGTSGGSRGAGHGGGGLFVRSRAGSGKA